MTKNLSILAAAVLVLSTAATSCRKKGADRSILDIKEGSALTINNGSTSTIVLKMDSSDIEVAQLKWLPSNFGYNATTQEYLVDVKGSAETWDKATTLVMGKATKTAWTHFDLNDVAQKHGIAADAEGTLNVRITSRIPGATSLNASVSGTPVNVKVKTFAMQKSMLTVTGSPIVLKAVDEYNQAVKLDWTEVIWAYPITTQYELQYVLKGHPWADAMKKNVAGALGNTFTHKALNQLALDLGADTLGTDTVLVRVKAMQPNTSRMTISDEKEIVVTTYDFNAVNAKLWVAGDYQGWSPSSAPYIEELVKNSSIFTGIVEKTKSDGTIGSGYFKFTSQPDWNGTNYGINATDNTKIDASGSDIYLPDGTYDFTVNTSTKAWSYVLVNWGLIGSATPGGWNDDTNMRYNPASKMYEITLNLVAGAVKFRENDSWGNNLGDNGNDGTAEANGTDIPVATAGNYTIKLDVKGQVYTIVKNP